MRRLADQDGTPWVIPGGKIRGLSDVTVGAGPRMSDEAQSDTWAGVQNSSAVHGNQSLEALTVHHLGGRLGLSQGG